jgi:hypothetical protein
LPLPKACRSIKSAAVEEVKVEGTMTVDNPHRHRQRRPLPDEHDQGRRYLAALSTAWERAQLKLDRLALKLFCSSAEMPNAIKDEFTDLPVSRQRRYQLRMRRDGRCILCGESAVGAFYCLKHMVKVRERIRRRLGSSKRLKGARSYRLEQKMQSARRRHLKK